MADHTSIPQTITTASASSPATTTQNQGQENDTTTGAITSSVPSVLTSSVGEAAPSSASAIPATALVTAAPTKSAATVTTADAPLASGPPSHQDDTTPVSDSKTHPPNLPITTSAAVASHADAAATSSLPETQPSATLKEAPAPLATNHETLGSALAVTPTSTPTKAHPTDNVPPSAAVSVTDIARPSTSPSIGNTTQNVIVDSNVVQPPATNATPDAAHQSVNPNASLDTTATIVPNSGPAALTDAVPNPSPTPNSVAGTAQDTSPVSAAASGAAPNTALESAATSVTGMVTSIAPPVPGIPTASMLASAPAVSTVPALSTVAGFASMPTIGSLSDDAMIPAVSTVPSMPVVSSIPATVPGAVEPNAMSVTPSTMATSLGISPGPVMGSVTTAIPTSLPATVGLAGNVPMATQTAMSIASPGAGSIPMGHSTLSSMELATSAAVPAGLMAPVVGVGGAIKGIGGGGRAASGAAGAARAAAVAAAAAASSRMGGLMKSESVVPGITMGEEPLLEVAEASRLANDAFNRVKAEKIAEQSMHINRAEEAAQYEGLGSEIVGKAMKQRERERSNRAAAAASRARVITYQQELEARLNRMEAERNAYRREVILLQSRVEAKMEEECKNEAVGETGNSMVMTGDASGGADAGDEMTKEHADGDGNMKANGEGESENEAQSRNQLEQVQLWVKRIHSQDPQLFSQVGAAPNELEMLLKTELVHDRPISTEGEPSSKRRRL